MKTTLISLMLLLVSLAGIGQKNEYYTAMSESLGQYANCRSTEDYRTLANRFDMIAKMEQNEWLPAYYHAQCYILMSFMEPSDATKKDAFLDIAEKSVNHILELAPEEAEISVLQAMYYSARLVVNPMERGQKYSMLSGQAVSKALSIEPLNPRAKFIKIQNEMGTARFFGMDEKVYCKDAEELLTAWDNYKPKSPLYPNWGKGQVVELVKSCK